MLRLATCLALATALRPSPARRSGAAPRRASDSSSLDFLEDNLGDASSAAEERARPLMAPFGGVSVSPEGFVAILASPKDDSPQRALPVLVHRADVDGVVSPFALGLLQLIQGIDVATAAVLPPDALETCFDGASDGATPRTLRRVRVVAATAPRPEPVPERSAAFEDVVAEKAEKLRGALSSGLGVAAPAGVAEDLLRVHAADDGSLSREGFAAVVAACREAAGPVSRDPYTAFQLVSDDGATTDVSPFLGFALALRHKAPLDLGAGLFESPAARDAEEILATLPVKRLEELTADGARISAHFASMFDAATKEANTQFGGGAPKVG